MQSPGESLRGPARLLSNSAKVLLVASGLLAIEAATIIFLGETRDSVVKPFILLGYLEICAMFFSALGIVCATVGLVFYRPYQFICEQFLMLRGHRAQQASGYTFENVPSPIHIPNPDEDGTPD